VEVVPLTGLVNYPSDTRLYEHLKNKAELKVNEVKGEVSYRNSFAQDVTCTVPHNPQGDMGDYAVVDKDGHGGVTLTGESRSVFIRDEQIEQLRLPMNQLADN